MQMGKDNIISCDRRRKISVDIQIDEQTNIDQIQGKIEVDIDRCIDGNIHRQIVKCIVGQM